MAFQDVVFWVLAVANVVAALGVVLLRDVFRAALLLVVVFLTVAGFFVLMNAEFLAVVQVLIYAGAVAVLIIFAIMLTREVQRGNLPNRLQPAAVVLPALLLAAMVFVALDTDWRLLASEDDEVPGEQALEDRFVRDQAVRRTVELLHASTIGGLPLDWEDSFEEGIQKDIDEAKTGREADLVAEQLAYVERHKLLGIIGSKFLDDLDEQVLSEDLREELKGNGLTLSEDAAVETRIAGNKWRVMERGEVKYTVTRNGDGLAFYEGRFENADDRSSLGDVLINDFVLPFEVASVVLLAAVIGALVLVRER